MDTTAVPHAHLFISLYLLGPTDNADPPTSPQMRPFLPEQEAENILIISHVLLSQFFPFPQDRQMQGPSNLTNSSQSMSSKTFWTWTQLPHSLLNWPNQVHEVNVRPTTNKLSLPNFFQFRQTPQTMFVRQKLVQLRTGFRLWLTKFQTFPCQNLFNMHLSQIIFLNLKPFSAYR